MRKSTLGTRILLALAAASLFSGMVAALISSESGSLEELAPGVYFREGELEHQGHCNNGIVVFDEFVVVIDANFPSGAEACLADIRKVTDKPVRLVFDTHHHGDHAYGNPVWVANGALTVAHENVVQEMDRYEPLRWREKAAERKDVDGLGLRSAQPPIVTYPDRLVIDDGTQRLELLHFGTAHTRGDGFAYLPRHRIVFTGDAVVNGPYNYMGDGDTHSWIGVIEALEKLRVETVAPGHGPPRGPIASGQAEGLYPRPAPRGGTGTVDWQEPRGSAENHPAPRFGQSPCGELVRVTGRQGLQREDDPLNGRLPQQV